MRSQHPYFRTPRQHDREAWEDEIEELLIRNASRVRTAAQAHLIAEAIYDAGIGPEPLLALAIYHQTHADIFLAWADSARAREEFDDFGLT